MEKKRKAKKPITVNKDVWFYLNEKSFTFVVWAGEPSKRKSRVFELPHKLIKKYLLSN